MERPKTPVGYNYGLVLLTISLILLFLGLTYITYRLFLKYRSSKNKLTNEITGFENKGYSVDVS